MEKFYSIVTTLNSPKYRQIPKLQDEEGDDDDFLSHSQKRPEYPSLGSRTNIIHSPIWFFATLACVAVFIFERCTFSYTPRSALLSPSIPSPGSYERGFTTDLLAATTAIRLETKRFSNSLRVDAHGKIFAWLNPNEPIYIGPPDSEVDAAWEGLIGDRYFGLSSSEISTLNTDLYLPPVSPIPTNVTQAPPTPFAALAIHHDLHCLNTLRRHLRPTYYADSLLPIEYREQHIDHCIDQLRQAIMCHGDLTPVTLRTVWADGDDQPMLVGESERLHTCRSEGAIREWVSERGKEMGVFEM